MPANFSSNPRRRKGRDELRARMRAIGSPCWICGMPIRYDIPSGNPLSYELDELVPVSKGGSPTDPGNVASAHRCCNQWRGNKSVRLVSSIKGEALSVFGGWTSPLDFVSKARAVIKYRKTGTRQRPVHSPMKHSREW